MAELVGAYMEDIKVQYSKDITGGRPEGTCSPDSNYSAEVENSKCTLVRSVEWYDTSHTYKTVEEQAPSLISLLDAKSQQFESVEDAAKLPTATLYHLYQYYEYPVSYFLNARGMDQPCKARELRME